MLFIMMKGASFYLPLLSLCFSCLYANRCVPRCPTEERCISYLAAVSHVRVPSHCCPAICIYQMSERAWMASRLMPLNFFSIFPYLTTTNMMSNLLVFSTILLYFAYAYSSLCICTFVAYLLAGTTHHVLAAKCLLAAHPEIQLMVLYLC